MQRTRPSFVATNIITGDERTPRVVMEANRTHNTSRTAKLERVVFVNDITPEQALAAVCDEEGVLDIVTEIAPTDVERVRSSRFAKLETIEANRVLLGIFNTWPDTGRPLGDRRVREAINLAVDRQRIVSEGLLGHARALGALTPPWAGGGSGAEPRTQDADRARDLLGQAGWPEGTPLRVATPGGFEGLARMVAGDIAEVLGITTEVIVVPDEDMTAGSRVLIEKKITPPWDLLMHAWFDLSSDLPPAVMHREFFGDDGGFRAGPIDEQFNERFDALVRLTDPEQAQAAAREIDRYCHEQAKALFLCAPHALYAVNKQVNFVAYRTTLELADTTVSDEHWSRRD